MLSILFLILLTLLPLSLGGMSSEQRKERTSASGIPQQRSLNDFLRTVAEKKIPEIRTYLEKELKARAFGIDDTDPATGANALLIACDTPQGDPQVVELLLQQGASPNFKRSLDGATPLMVAAKAGNLDTMRILLSKTININTVSNNGSTVLHFAAKAPAQSPALDIIRLLVEEGVNIDKVNALKKMALHVASSGGSWNVVRYLITKSQNPDTGDGDDDTYAHYACGKQPSLEIIMKAFERGSSAINKPNKGGDTPLHIACQWGHLDIVSFLTSKKVGLEATNQQGETPLTVACKCKHYDLAKMLLRAGAHPAAAPAFDNADEEKSKELRVLIEATKEQLSRKKAATPEPARRAPTAQMSPHAQPFKEFMAALRDREYALAQTFMDCEIRQRLFSVEELDPTTGVTPLMMVCDDPHAPLEIVRLLVQNGAQVNSKRPNDGATPTMIAAKAGNVDVFRYLLPKTININTLSNNGSTALHYACRAGNSSPALEIVKLLVEAGINVDKTNAIHKAAIHVAASAGSWKLVSYLLNKTRQIDLADGDNDTVIHYACGCRPNLDIIIKVFEKGSCALDKPNASSFRPLHIAAKEGHVDIVSYLLSKRVTYDAMNASKETPLALACKQKDSDMIRLLIQHGAQPQLVPATYITPDIKQIFEKKIIGTITEFHMAVAKKDLTLIKQLYEKHIIKDKHYTLSDTDERSSTALHKACDSQGGNAILVQFLLERGAQVSLKNDDGHTPLALACMYGYVPIVKLLLSVAQDIETRDKKDNTPLELACEAERVDIIQLLLEKGASSANIDQGKIAQFKPEIQKVLEPPETEEQKRVNRRAAIREFIKEKKLGSWSAVYLMITNDEKSSLEETDVYEALGFKASTIRSSKTLLSGSLLDGDDTAEMNWKKVYRKLILVFHEDKFTEELCKAKARVVTRMLTNANEELQANKQ